MLACDTIVYMMKRKAFRAVLSEFASRPGDSELLLKSDGTVNASAFARAIGCTQATISRALNNANYQPKKDLVDKVSRYFAVSAAQARGEEALQYGAAQADTLPARTRQFANRFERLNPTRKKILEMLLAELEEDVQRLRKSG